jgi:CRISPR-associated protein Csd1
MILQRLYDLAERKHLLADSAFEEMPVPYIIVLGPEGQYQGIEERRGELTLPPAKKGGEPRKRPDRGKPLRVPRPHGAPNNQGFARYFADTLPRVLPINDEARSARSRETFWQQIERAATETGDPALKAVQCFGQRLRDDPDLAARVRADVAKIEASETDRCTFRWDPDRGLTILDRDGVRAWFRAFLESVTGARQQEGPSGVCQITGTVGPLPTTHSIKLTGIPGGLAMGVSVVSYDKAAFESYGLDGTANAGIGYTAADGYLLALTALIQNRIPGQPRSSLRVAGNLLLWWTQKEADTGFMNVLDNPDPAQVEQLLASPGSGREVHGLDDKNAFYLLGLSGNSARAIVRDYLEAPLPRVRENVARWFRDLRIADLSRDGAGKPTSLFPLWQLVLATAADSDRVAPDVPGRLCDAALKGDALPDSILAGCVARLRAEGDAGFRPARLALIKLYLLRRNFPVTETLNTAQDKPPAYVCGRLLAVFEQIQYAALGDINATVTDKYFGTFSAAPAMVLGRLYANAQNHLGKLRGDSSKRGAYIKLDTLLGEVSNKLDAPPQGQLSLEEQGWFALGYYHQKARKFEDIAERKAIRSESATE